MFTASLFYEEFHAGIIDPMMEYTTEDEIEAPRDLAEVPKREVASNELIIKEYAGDDAVRQSLYSLGGRVVERA